MVDSHGYLADQSFDCEDEVFAAIDESNPNEKEDKDIPSPPKRARCALDAIEDGGMEEMSAGKLDQFNCYITYCSYIRLKFWTFLILTFPFFKRS